MKAEETLMTSLLEGAKQFIVPIVAARDEIDLFARARATALAAHSGTLCSH